MAPWIHCPQCDQHYQLPPAAAGKQPACPKCGRTLTAAPTAPMPIPPAPHIPLPKQTESDEPLWALPVHQPARKPVAAPAAPAENLPATADNPDTYYHAACGGCTKVSADVMARFAGDPFGYIPASFCAVCRRYVGLRGLVWHGTRETVAAYRLRLRRQMHPFLILLRLVGGALAGALLGAAVGAAANAHNPRALGLGALAGVVIGLPLGYFVAGIAFQVGWALSRGKKPKGA